MKQIHNLQRAHYLNLLLGELRLGGQAGDLGHGRVGELLVGVAQQGVVVHGRTVGGDAAEGDQELGLDHRCCSRRR